MAVPDSTPVVSLPAGKRGQFTLVDAADAEWLRFRRIGVNHDGYAMLRGKMLHRVLLDVPAGLVTDHINGDRLDNRRANLRICTQAQNLANGRSHSDSRSKYRGVSWKAREGSWRAQISIGGQRSRFLGQWPTEEDAALAYDQAAREQYGEYARLNFPGMPPSEPHRYKTREVRRVLGLPMKRMSGPGGIRTRDLAIMSGLPGPADD